jgi:anthranilate phosphoribosyltransferase
MSLALKKLINKELGAAGLAGFVDPAAVQRLADAVQEEQRHDLIKEVLDICQTGGDKSAVSCLFDPSRNE